MIKATKRSATYGHYLVMIVFSAWILLPLVWALSLSLKTPTDIVNIPDKLFFTPTFENYFSVLREGEFVHQFSNSLIIGICSTILSLIIGVPAAYTLARFKFRASDNLQFWILSTRMAPPVAVLIPYFIVFQKLHMVDTYPAIIIMHLSVNLVLAIWLMRGFFADIPEEINEAALVDGCTYWGAFFRINLPLAIGGIAATTILSFMFSWNELMFALTLSGTTVKTAPVGVFNFIGFEEVAWGPLMAATIVLLIPIVVFVTLVQNALVRGLTFGAVKG
jgi:multiple sugar transport system permease protein